MSRHSIKNTKRLVRGARGAAARAEVRYSKNDPVAALLRQCVSLLTAAEKKLLEANRRAVAREERWKAA
jgi:hypothetical protein